MRYVVTCHVCGREFKAVRNDAKYCSSKCRTKALRQKRKEQASEKAAQKQTLSLFHVVVLKRLDAITPFAIEELDIIRDHDFEMYRHALNAIEQILIAHDLNSPGCNGFPKI